MLVATVILLWAQAKSGDYLDAMTDHFHHSRATWTFFVCGFDVYTHPFGDLAERVPYPQTWITWPKHPVAYPPGMFAVFALPALLGRYVPLSTLEFGKIVIAYLSLFMHAALWAIALVSRRVGSKLWAGVVVFVWIFSVRIGLLGFYDGVWLLTGALAVHAMTEGKAARAVTWFVVSALVSYRAACLAPIALVAFAEMLRGPEPRRTKALVTTFALASAAVVLLCFRALLRYGPSEDDGAHGLAFGSTYALVMLAMGFGVSAAVAARASVLVGACVALSTVLAIPHAGHNWHGYVCIAPILAMPLATRRPLWSQILVALWFVVFLQLLFGYPPLLWLDELMRYIQRNGHPPLY